MPTLTITENAPQDPIIAQVNGEPLSLSQIIRKMNVSNEIGFFDTFVRQILIRQLAQQEGLEITTNDLQRKVNDWRYQHRLEQVSDTEAYLTQRGITLEDVAETVTIQRLEYLLSVSVSQDKIEPYFVQNKMDFDTAEICWIFLHDEATADELSLQLSEENADFHKLARQHSQDETTRPSSGYLGRLRRKHLPKSISARLFATQVGSIIGPEKVSGGYALYLLQNLYPATLDQDIKKEIRKKLFHQWLQIQMRQAKIDHPFFEKICPTKTFDFTTR